MADANPDETPKPIEVAASPAGEQTTTGLRDFLLLVAALPALIAVLGTRNVKDIVDWFAGEQGLAFIALVVALATPLYRQWLARRNHAVKLKLAENVDDEIGIVKGTGK